MVILRYVLCVTNGEKVCAENLTPLSCLESYKCIQCHDVKNVEIFTEIHLNFWYLEDTILYRELLYVSNDVMTVITFYTVFTFINYSYKWNK